MFMKFPPLIVGSVESNYLRRRGHVGPDARKIYEAAMALKNEFVGGGIGRRGIGYHVSTTSMLTILEERLGGELTSREDALTLLLKFHKSDLLSVNGRSIEGAHTKESW